ncbi:MAG: 4-vinyl reductase [Polyangiaceae bacterium]|nr:4-vinyl reductase [Polyangiaceae bacterium]
MAIDERTIVLAVAGLGFSGNEEGLIPAFGLHLTRHFADYYNRISYGLLGDFVRRLPELSVDATELLVEAGHVCSFHTFGGIMMSVEWDAIVRPMIEGREDWVRGMVGVVNAFGWGRWRVASLSPGERLVLEIEDSYEAAGFARDYPMADGPRCFLATGGVAGLMNLVYQGDVTARPALTEAHYVEVFRHPRSFRAREVRCAAMGDARCEIIAERMTGR